MTRREQALRDVRYEEAIDTLAQIENLPRFEVARYLALLRFIRWPVDKRLEFIIAARGLMCEMESARLAKEKIAAAVSRQPRATPNPAGLRLAGAVTAECRMAESQ